MIATFAVHSELHLSKSHASYLTGVFWVSFTIGRIVAIACSYFVSLSKTLIVSHMILSASALLLLMLGTTSELCLWMGAAGLGLGLSSLYGNAVAWTVQYVKLQHSHMGFVQVRSGHGTASLTCSTEPPVSRLLRNCDMTHKRLISFLQFMTCFGTLTPPILLGSQIVESPKTLMHWTTGLVAAIGVNRIVMMWSSRGHVKLAAEGADRASFEEIPQSELDL